MEITVKRKLWIFSATMPVILEFNGKSVGALYGSQEMTIPMAEDEGELKYFQLIGRNDKIDVKSGDTVKVEETLMGKALSTLFVIFMCYLLIKAFTNLSLMSFSNYEELIMIEQIFFGVIFVIAISSIFFKTHKLALTNR